MFTTALVFITVATLVSTIAGGYTLVDSTFGEIPNPSVLDTILASIVEICVGTVDNNVSFYAGGLFKYLIIFDFVIAVIFGLLSFENGPNFITLFSNKMFKYGFWLWVISHWRDLITKICSSLVQVGLFASEVDTNIMMHPSWFVTKGFSYAGAYFEFAISGGKTGEKSSIFSFLSSFDFSFIFKYIIAIITALLVILAFFIIALNVFITTAEFYICSALMLIFVPFAVFEKTEKFASQAFSLVISTGTRMMVLCLVLSLLEPLMGTNSPVKKIFIYKESPSVLAAVFCFCLAGTLAYLSVEIPSLASSIVQGGLHLDSTSVKGAVSSTANMAGSAVGGVASLGAMTGGGSSRGVSAYRAAANAGAGTLGAVGQAVTGFAKGVASGAMASQFGGREESIRVYRAAAGNGSSGKGSSNKKKG